MSLRLAAAIVAAIAIVLIYFGTYRTTKAPYALWWSAVVGFSGAGALCYMAADVIGPIAGPLGNGLRGAAGVCVWIAARSLRGAHTNAWTAMLAPLGLFFVSVVEWPEDDAWPSGVATLVYMTALMGLSTRELLMVAEGRLQRGRVAVRGESWFAIGAMSVTSIVVTLYYAACLIAYLVVGPSDPSYQHLLGPDIVALGTMSTVLVVTYSVSELSRFEMAVEWQLRADRDDLTELLNRNAFRAYTEAILADADQSGAVLMILDFDRFKQLNDSGGHEVGDRALVAFAEACREVLHESDRAARWGGDEFLIALSPGTYKRAVAVYQGLSEAVAKAARRGDPMPTLSAGVAKAEPGITLDEWVGRADRALLEAKRRGRAQVVVHDGTEDKESFTASGTR